MISGSFLCQILSVGMSSIRKGRHILSNLIECLQDQYTTGQLDALVKAFSKPRNTSFRLNRLKVATNDRALEAKILYEIQECLRSKKLKSKILKLDWNSSFFILTEPDAKVADLYHLPCHTTGLIHFQSLSSMIPPLVLDVEPGSRVLDLCCAPGGKTFQLLEKQPSILVANDISSDRLSRFYRNMHTLVPSDSSSTVHVRSVDARKFQLLNEDEIIGSRPFDYILLDAPCSGEGIINLKEYKSYKYWSLQSVKKFARLQASLLETAYSLLSKGGSIVYSTCTLNTIENENVALGFLKRHSDLSMCDLSSFSQTPLQDSRFLRVFPDSQYQGFFICRFKKS